MASPAAGGVPISSYTEQQMVGFCCFTLNLSRSAGAWWGEDRQTSEVGGLSPWLLASPCCSLTEGGCAGQKRGNNFMRLSPNIPDKRLNSVLLSLDRNIYFSGKSDFIWSYKIA